MYELHNCAHIYAIVLCLIYTCNSLLQTSAVYELHFVDGLALSYNAGHYVLAIMFYVLMEWIVSCQHNLGKPGDFIPSNHTPSVLLFTSDVGRSLVMFMPGTRLHPFIPDADGSSMTMLVFVWRSLSQLWMPRLLFQCCCLPR